MAVGEMHIGHRSRRSNRLRSGYRRRHAAVVLAIVSGFTGTTYAQSSTYINPATGGNYSDGNNWQGLIVADGVNSIANFGTLNLTADNTVNFDGPRTLGGLIFGDTTPSHNWTLGAAAASPNILTLQTNVAGVLPSINVINQTATIQAPVAGNQGFVKNGAGTLVFNTNASTYTGNAVVNTGTLSLQIGQSTTAGFILNDGSALATNQALATTNLITAASGTSRLALSSLTAFNALYSGNGNLILTNGTTTPTTFGNGGGTGVTTLQTFGGSFTFGSNFTIRVASNSSASTFAASFATVDFANTTGGIYSRNATTYFLGGVAGTNFLSTIGPTTNGGTVNMFVGSANTDTSYAGIVAAGGASNPGFTKIGFGTLTLNPQISFTSTGGLNVNGGTLRADYVNASAAVFNSVSTIGFGGGTLALRGKSAGTTAQTVGNVTVNVGGGRLLVDTNGGTATNLTMGSLTATANGGSFNITKVGAGASTITTTTNKLADGTYGGRITFGTDWATTASVATPFVLSAYAGYNTLAPGFAGAVNTTNDRIDATTGNVVLTAAYTANSLKIDPGAGQSLDLGGQIATLTNGGLLFTGTNDFTILNGSLTANNTATPDVVVHHLGTGVLNMNAVVANNGANVTRFTKAGDGNVILGGSNTYTGTTTINSGVLSISSNANLGAESPGAAVNFFGGTLQATGTFGLFNGAAGTNNRGLVVNGGGGTVEVTSGNTLTVAGLVSSGANTFGSLTKTGTGTLVLSANNTYTGATRIAGGTLSVASIGNGGANSGIGASVRTGNALILDGGTLRFTGTSTSTDRTFTVGPNGGGLDASGVAEVAFLNTLPVVVSGAGTRTLTLSGTNTANNILAASIVNPNSGVTNLTKSDVGRWILTGGSSYTGNTTIGGGTLALSAAASIAPSAVISVAAGAALDAIGLNNSIVTLGGAQTLTGGGNVFGGVNTVAGSAIAPGSSAVGTLTVDSLTLNPGANGVFEFNNTPANDKIVVNNNNGFTLNGGGFTLLVEGSPTQKFTVGGTYDLIQYLGTIGGTGLDASWTTPSGSNPHVLNPQAGLVYSFGTDGTNLELTISGTAALVAQWIATTDGNWSNGVNWNPSVPMAAGDTANFTTAQPSLRTVTLDVNETVGSVNFDSASNGYNIIASGGSILTLDNVGSDATVGVVSGNHTISAPINLNDNMAVTVAGASNSLAILGNINNGDAAHTLLKTGDGLLELAGNNAYGPAAGNIGTILGGGTLQIGSSAALGAGDLSVISSAAALRAGVNGLSLANNVVLSSPVTATIDTQGNGFTMSGIIYETAASSGVTKVGAGTLVLSNASTYTGSTTVAAGTLRLGAGGITGSVNGSIVNNGMLVLDRSDDNTLANSVSGTGALTKVGPNNATVNGINSFTGDTVVGGGTLTIGSATALQSSTLDYNNQGGTLSFGTQTATTLGGLKGAQDLALVNDAAAAVGLTVGGNGAGTTYSGALSGTGASVNKAGSGLLTLTGNNSYTGSTTSNGGQLVLGTNGVINGSGVFATAGNIQVNGGTLTAGAASNINQGQSITVTSGSANFAGINSTYTGGDNLALRVEGGSLTTTFYNIVRNQNYQTLSTTAGAVGNTGFYTTGGTSIFSTDLTIGALPGNSSASAKIDGATADVSVNGSVIVGNNGVGRFNTLAVNNGTFSAPGTTTGIILSAGAGNSEVLLTGGTTNAGRIGFGTATTVGGAGFLFVNGGTLSIGSGGIETPTGSTVVPYIGLVGGTLGASANWSSSLPMVLGTQTVAYNNAAAAPVTATFTAAGGLTIKAADLAGAAQNISLSGSLSGAGGITKTGGGILSVSAGNTYTGNTQINAGTFAVGSGGSITSPIVAVGTGAALDVTASGGMTFNNRRLRGTGTVFGDTTFTGTGAIAPGGTTAAPGIGTLVAEGNFTLDTGATFIAEVDFANDLTSAPVADLLRVTVTGGEKTVTIVDGAVFQFSFLNAGTGDVTPDRTVVLIQNDGANAVVGNAANATIFTSPGTLVTLAYDYDTTSQTFGSGNDVAAVISEVPEPTSLGLIGLGAAGLLGRRRRRMVSVA